MIWLLLIFITLYPIFSFHESHPKLILYDSLHLLLYLSPSYVIHKYLIQVFGPARSLV